jgi:hypothetical protein
MLLSTALTIGGLGVSAIGSISQMISGASRTSKAKRALENYQRQELRNVTEGMRTSTLKAEQETEKAYGRFATSVDALRSGGVRGVVGGLARQEMLAQDVQQKISADLDRQQREIEMMRAQDEANIRAMQERRESEEIQGMGAEIAAGRQLTQSGIGGFMNTGLATAQLASDGAFDGLSTAGMPRTNKLSGVEKTFGFGSFKSNVDPDVKIKNINRGSLFGGGLKDSFMAPTNEYQDPYTT